MMKSAVTVGFLGHHVRVHADSASVRRVERSFEALLATGSPTSSEVLTLGRSGANHALYRDDALIFEDERLSEAQRMLRHEIILSFVHAHPQLLWLHAGAAVIDDRAVVFIGQYGRGKSTVISELCRRGWRYASDDIVPIDLTSLHILPFPLTPVVRQGVGEQLPPEEVSNLRKVKVALPWDALQRVPVPIGGIVLPEFRSGATAASGSFSASDVALAIVREGINRELHGREAVVLASRLVNDVPVLSLIFSDASSAADTVEREVRGAAVGAL